MEISSITTTPISLTRPSLSSSNSTFVNSVHFKRTFTNPLVISRTRNINDRGNKRLSCNALFGLGVPELVVIAGVAALVFGPKKLPEVGKSIGKTVKSFQQAAKEFESELKKEPDAADVTPVEKPTAVSGEKKQDIEVSSSKEIV